MRLLGAIKRHRHWSAFNGVCKKNIVLQSNSSWRQVVGPEHVYDCLCHFKVGFILILLHCLVALSLTSQYFALIILLMSREYVILKRSRDYLLYTTMEKNCVLFNVKPWLHYFYLTKILSESKVSKSLYILKWVLYLLLDIVVFIKTWFA